MVVDDIYNTGHEKKCEMNQENFFSLMNTESKSVAIVCPKNVELEYALKGFVVEAVKISLRVLFVLDEQSQCDAFLKYFHSEITGKYSTNPVVYSLRFGGTVRCVTYDQTLDLPENYVPDVAIFHHNCIDIGVALDLSDFQYNKKLIISTRQSEEYLGCIVNSYHTLTQREL